MTKQHFKQAVIFLLLTLGLYFLAIPPLFQRGTVEIFFENKLSHPYTVVSVNEQPVNETVGPGATPRVRYDIRWEGGLSAVLDRGLPAGDSAVQIAGYIEPSYYGNATVTVFLDDSHAEAIHAKEHIRF